MRLMELHRRLKEEGHITFNRQYLAQLANEGRIPFKTDHKGRKMFKYLSVLKALTEGGHINIDGDMNEKTLAKAKQNLYHWRGQLAKQKHDVEAGILIYRKDVEQKAFTVVRVIRDQLLAMPERITADIITANSPEAAKEIMLKELLQILDSVKPEDLIP